jgi:hypothetical protein
MQHGSRTAELEILISDREARHPGKRRPAKTRWQVCCLLSNCFPEKELRVACHFSTVRKAELSRTPVRNSVDGIRATGPFYCLLLSDGIRRVGGGFGRDLS